MAPCFSAVLPYFDGEVHLGPCDSSDDENKRVVSAIVSRY